MRIGVNLLYLLPGLAGGSETYAKGLLDGLMQINQEDQFIVFVNRESADWALPAHRNFTQVVCPVFAASRVSRYSFEQIGLPSLLKQYHIDVVHSLGYVTPLAAAARSVVSILDIVYDYPGGFCFAKRQVLKFLLLVSAHRAHHILTLSNSSRDQIIRRLKVHSRKVTVTLLAPKTRNPCDERKWPDLTCRLRIKTRYVLALSSLSPSKNIPTLLRAFARLPVGHATDVQLVLVGHEPRSGTSLRQLTESLGLAQRVIFTGYLSDDDLSLVFKHATVFVFPSLYEGFGLPILEAMAHGVPVACSNVASLPEVAGDAALLFNPRAEGDIVAALNELLTHPGLANQLVLSGFRNLSRFSWEDTAKKTLEVYTRVFSAPYAG